jgi:hypothetical protein
MSARRNHSVGKDFHTDFMTHQLLWSVLDAQRANATLSGGDLRAAAEHLADLCSERRVLLMAVDNAGERIIGAAMTVAEVDLDVYDYTSGFPQGSTCLLVGGHVAGHVRLADAAAAALSAGAAQVEAAILGGWPDPVPGVAQIRGFRSSQFCVA